jgi:O-acetyl-ADP-ribose deacetylase
MKFEIYLGDITDQETDAIVNAANNHLWMGSGVAGAIKRKGGPMIEDEAVKVGPIDVGQAVATNAGNLSARYVIHAAGMGQDLQTSDELVRTSSLSSLKEAERLKLKSIAFPAIGTGVGGLDMRRCAEIMIKVIKGFEPEFLREVRFVLFDQNSYEVFKEVAEI